MSFTLNWLEKDSGKKIATVLNGTTSNTATVAIDDIDMKLSLVRGLTDASDYRLDFYIDASNSCISDSSYVEFSLYTSSSSNISDLEHDFIAKNLNNPRKYIINLYSTSDNGATWTSINSSNLTITQTIPVQILSSSSDLDVKVEDGMNIYTFGRDVFTLKAVSKGPLNFSSGIAYSWSYLQDASTCDTNLLLDSSNSNLGWVSVSPSCTSLNGKYLTVYPNVNVNTTASADDAEWIKRIYRVKAVDNRSTINSNCKLVENYAYVQLLRQTAEITDVVTASPQDIFTLNQTCGSDGNLSLSGMTTMYVTVKNMCQIPTSVKLTISSSCSGSIVVTSVLNSNNYEIIDKCTKKIIFRVDSSEVANLFNVTFNQFNKTYQVEYPTLSCLSFNLEACYDSLCLMYALPQYNINRSFRCVLNAPRAPSTTCSVDLCFANDMTELSTDASSALIGVSVFPYVANLIDSSSSSLLFYVNDQLVAQNTLSLSSVTQYTNSSFQQFAYFTFKPTVAGEWKVKFNYEVIYCGTVTTCCDDDTIIVCNKETSCDIVMKIDSNSGKTEYPIGGADLENDGKMTTFCLTTDKLLALCEASYNTIELTATGETFTTANGWILYKNNDDTMEKISSGCFTDISNNSTVRMKFSDLLINNDLADDCTETDLFGSYFLNIITADGDVCKLHFRLIHPVDNVLLEADNLELNCNETVTLQAIVDLDVPRDLHYCWYLNGALIQNKTQQTLELNYNDDKAGTYQVVVKELLPEYQCADCSYNYCEPLIANVQSCVGIVKSNCVVVTKELKVVVHKVDNCDEVVDAEESNVVQIAGDCQQVILKAFVSGLTDCDYKCSWYAYDCSNNPVKTQLGNNLVICELPGTSGSHSECLTISATDLEKYLGKFIQVKVTYLGQISSYCGVNTRKVHCIKDSIKLEKQIRLTLTNNGESNLACGQVSLCANLFDVCYSKYEATYKLYYASSLINNNGGMVVNNLNNPTVIKTKTVATPNSMLPNINCFSIDCSNNNAGYYYASVDVKRIISVSQNPASYNPTTYTYTVEADCPVLTTRSNIMYVDERYDLDMTYDDCHADGFDYYYGSNGMNDDRLYLIVCDNGCGPRNYPAGTTVEWTYSDLSLNNVVLGTQTLTASDEIIRLNFNAAFEQNGRCIFYDCNNQGTVTATVTTTIDGCRIVSSVKKQITQRIKVAVELTTDEINYCMTVKNLPGTVLSDIEYKWYLNGSTVASTEFCGSCVPKSRVTSSIRGVARVLVSTGTSTSNNTPFAIYLSGEDTEVLARSLRVAIPITSVDIRPTLKNVVSYSAAGVTLNSASNYGRLKAYVTPEQPLDDLSFQWYKNNVELVGENSAVIQPRIDDSITGVYTVRVTSMDNSVVSKPYTVIFRH